MGRPGPTLTLLPRAFWNGGPTLLPQAAPAKSLQTIFERIRVTGGYIQYREGRQHCSQGSVCMLPPRQSPLSAVTWMSPLWNATVYLVILSSLSQLQTRLCLVMAQARDPYALTGHPHDKASPCTSCPPKFSPLGRACHPPI